jgi:hypothetical protein
MQRTQLEYYHTQGIPTENASGPQCAHFWLIRLLLLLLLLLVFLAHER